MKKRGRCCQTAKGTHATMANKLVTHSLRPFSREAAAGGLSPSDSPGISPTGHGGKEGEQNIAHPHEKRRNHLLPAIPPSLPCVSVLPSFLWPKLPRNFVRCNVELETCERSHQ